LQKGKIFKGDGNSRIKYLRYITCSVMQILMDISKPRSYSFNVIEKDINMRYSLYLLHIKSYEL